MQPSIREQRRAQMFPVLEPNEIERVRRFGTPVSFSKDQLIARAGEPPAGMLIILQGEVVITRKDALGSDRLIVEDGPGNFVGELAQLSGRPSLVDVRAKSAVDGLIITPKKLRAMLVEEAEIGERVMRALILRRVGLIEDGAGPVIVGHAAQADVLRLQNFLSRNGQPHLLLDPDKDKMARMLMDQLHVSQGELPIVLPADGQVLMRPSEWEVARSIGMVEPLDPDRVYDVAIVGAGPAGLATAVYAASEGLSVLVVDCRAFGGQAGASARIENYLGFPTGVSGLALMARAYNQAQKFGATVAIPQEVLALENAPDSSRGRFMLRLRDNQHVAARSVVIASGAQYRRLAVDNLDKFDGLTVHYWASPLERNLCSGQEIALVGGGNSAGQAVVYLAEKVAKLYLIVRGPGLEASMSRYLIDRISALSNVELVTETEVVALEGNDGVLEAARWRNRRSGLETRRNIHHMFLFIGADPNTDWLVQCHVAVDENGFVCTGAKLGSDRPSLATSRDGVFAVGDIRSGSIKRVAAAVGEGAQVVAELHTYLAAAADKPIS